VLEVVACAGRGGGGARPALGPGCCAPKDVGHNARWGDLGPLLHSVIRATESAHLGVSTAACTRVLRANTPLAAAPVGATGGRGFWPR